MVGFGIPEKRIILMGTSMEKTQCQIRANQTVSKSFIVEVGLKQGHSI